MKKRALVIGLAAVVLAGGGTIVLFSGRSTLTGTVSDEQGNPVGQCSVTPQGPRFSGEERGVLTLDNGNWTWGEVDNGPYAISAICPANELRPELRGTTSLFLVQYASTVTVTVS